MPEKDKGRGWWGESERHAKAAKKSSEGRLRSAVRAVGSAVGTLLRLPLTALGFVGAQLSGTRRNLGRAWNYLTFDNVLPPSIRDFIQWGIETTPKLFGIRDAKPWQQLGAAAMLIIVAVGATFLSGGLFFATVIIVGVFGLVGIVRHVPWVNKKWKQGTGLLPVKNDYDVPRWRRD